jgi:hypothetical protein
VLNVRKPQKSGGELAVGCLSCIAVLFVQMFFWVTVIVVIVTVTKWALVHV